MVLRRGCLQKVGRCSCVGMSCNECKKLISAAMWCCRQLNSMLLSCNQACGVVRKSGPCLLYVEESTSRPLPCQQAVDASAR